jgi:programmed cell death 6-interacting protein
LISPPEIYNDRRNTTIKEHVKDRAQQLNDSYSQWVVEFVGYTYRVHLFNSRELQSHNLPAALDALDKPIGLPPSLLKRAEEVRLENGPERVEKSLEDIEMLAQRAMAVLTEVCAKAPLQLTMVPHPFPQALDILDQEASEDEQLRRTTPTQRLPSHQANEKLTSNAERYRNILHQAAESDAVIRQRWDEWEDCIIQLTWDEVRGST